MIWNHKFHIIIIFLGSCPPMWSDTWKNVEATDKKFNIQYE